MATKGFNDKKNTGSMMILQDFKINYIPDSKGNYPLHVACKHGQHQIVQYLLKSDLLKDINH